MGRYVDNEKPTGLAWTNLEGHPYLIFSMNRRSTEALSKLPRLKISLGLPLFQRLLRLFVQLGVPLFDDQFKQGESILIPEQSRVREQGYADNGAALLTKNRGL